MGSGRIGPSVEVILLVSDCFLTPGVGIVVSREPCRVVEGYGWYGHTSCLWEGRKVIYTVP